MSVQKAWVFGIVPNEALKLPSIKGTGKGRTPPIFSNDHQKLFDDALYQANKYYNANIEIERERMISYRDIINRYTPGLLDLKEKEEKLKEKLQPFLDKRKELETTIKKYSQKHKIKKSYNDEIAKKKEELDKLNKDLENEHKELKKIRADIKELKTKNKSSNSNVKKKATEEALKEYNLQFGTNYSYKDYTEKPYVLGPNNPIRKIIKGMIEEKINSELSKNNDLKGLEQIALDSKSKNRRDELRHSKDVYNLLSSDSKTQITKSTEQAVKKTKSGELKWNKFDFSGKLSNQITEFSVKDLFENKIKNIQITFLDNKVGDKYSYDNDHRWDVKSGRGKTANAKLRFYFGEIKNGNFIECVVRIHRKIPSHFLVKRVALQSIKEGFFRRYNLIITLEDDDLNNFIHSDGVVEKRIVNDQVIALDVGWRYFPDGHLRAGCVGNSSFQDIIDLPSSLVKSFEKVDDIKSIRDKLFDNAKKVFNDIYTSTIDNNLKEDGKHISKIKSPPKLIKLINKYRTVSNTNLLWKKWSNGRKDRLPEKDQLFDWFKLNGIQDLNELNWLYLEWWYRQNRHLYQYESGLRKHCLNARKDLYRTIAVKYAKLGYKLIYEDFNKSKVASVDNRVSKGSNKHRVYVSTSELVNIFKNVFTEKYSQKINPEYSSCVCNNCGHDLSSDDGWDQRKGDVVQTCPDCNIEWDRDKNAVINMSKVEFKDDVGKEEKDK
jgi:hypothetical protein